MYCITAGCIRAWAISARCNTSNAGTRLSAKKPRKQRAKNSIQQSNITGNYLGNTGRFNQAPVQALKVWKMKAPEERAQSSGTRLLALMPYPETKKRLDAIGAKSMGCNWKQLTTGAEALQQKN